MALRQTFVVELDGIFLHGVVSKLQPGSWSCIVQLCAEVKITLVSVIFVILDLPLKTLYER
jgi:hypothetical protein